MELETVFASGLQINGVATVAGRTFAAVQGDAGGGDPPQLVELRDGAAVPYPDAAWNRAGDPGDGHFVGVNSVRTGPDGLLWAVDRGAPDIGEPRVDGGPRLVGIDVATDRVAVVHGLQDATRPWSFVDDVRFHGAHAYLTDAGAPAVIVLELATGRARRVLEGAPATIAQRPLVAEHRPLTTPGGAPVNIHVDQLEVSPDGATLFLQPCCGGMSSVPTTLLDDPDASERDLQGATRAFASTPSTGGTAMDADGTIYLSDVDAGRILTIDPSGAVDVLLDDPRLLWVDAMWIDDDGGLILPSAQLNRTAGLHGGTDVVEPPCTVYRLPLGVRPLRT